MKWSTVHPEAEILEEVSGTLMQPDEQKLVTHTSTSVKKNRWGVDIVRHAFVNGDVV